jgi:PPOX class probable F420-dependent enzyme
VAVLPDSAKALIDSDANVHLVTINPDGSPQTSMVWAGMVDEEICIGSLTMRQKLRNARRDPRVTLSIESPERDKLGLDFYLVVIGTARITEGGAPELVGSLAKRRLPPGTQFPRGTDHPPGWIMRITPERWRGYGPWSENVQ